MPETVKVSLLQPRAFRARKDAEPVRYKMGIQEMPIEHARAMGLMHRIVREVRTEEGKTIVTQAPFGGAFDEELSGILEGAGYRSIEELSKASQDDLMAIKGIGPANYERIRAATKGT